MMDVEQKYVDACMALHAKIKKVVHGKVVCRINKEQNTMNIMIINGDFRFSYDIYNIDDKMNRFYDCLDYTAYQVCNLYRKCLLMKYFRKENDYGFLI